MGGEGRTVELFQLIQRGTMILASVIPQATKMISFNAVAWLQIPKILGSKRTSQEDDQGRTVEEASSHRCSCRCRCPVLLSSDKSQGPLRLMRRHIYVVEYHDLLREIQEALGAGYEAGQVGGV